MAVEKSVVDAQVQALGAIDLFGTKKEMKYLPEIMMPGEIIYGICSAIMEGTTLCVITDQRLFLLDDNLFGGVKLIELPISQIKSVSYKIGLVFGELLVETEGQTIQVPSITKEAAPKMAATLSGLLHRSRAPSAPLAVPSVSPCVPSGTADPILQLERLFALKEKGGLTDTEFAQQKAKILGR